MSASKHENACLHNTNKQKIRRIFSRRR